MHYLKIISGQHAEIGSLFYAANLRFKLNQQIEQIEHKIVEWI